MNKPCESDLGVQGMLVNRHIHVSLTSRNIIFLPFSLFLCLTPTQTGVLLQPPRMFITVYLAPSGGNDGFLRLACVCPLFFKHNLELPIITRFYSRQPPLVRPPQNFLHKDGITFLSFSCPRNSHGGWKCTAERVGQIHKGGGEEEQRWDTNKKK